MRRVCTKQEMYVRPVHAFSIPLHGADSLPIQKSRDNMLIEVEFHILPTLPSEDPTVVRRKLATRQYRSRV
jgi:hypothetical protein